MVFIQKSATFKTATGAEITAYSENLAEPEPLAETEGTSLEIRYTPRGSPGESYNAGQRRGPAGYIRFEWSTNGTVWTEFPDGGAPVVGTVGVEQVRYFRAVALPYETTENPQIVWGVWVERGGLADVLAVPA